MFALLSMDTLRRNLVGGLGATFFGLTCLFAATGPAALVAPVQLASLEQPADSPSV